MRKMDKWIWTFSGNSKWSNKYVVVNADEMQGRLYVFRKYGQENMSTDYPYEMGMEKVVRRYNLKLLEEIELT